MAERRDLRDTHFIFSIDPKGSEDIDDALSLRRTPQGTLELGVHIADVTAFVAPGSLADVEARARYGRPALDRRRLPRPACSCAPLWLACWVIVAVGAPRCTWPTGASTCCRPC